MISRRRFAYRAPFRVFVNAYSGLSANIWLLALVTFINRSGTMVIPFMTVYLTVDRQFTLEQAGYVMSAFGLGSLLGSWLGGWLTDKIGFYKVQFWTLFGSGLIFMSLGWLETFWPLVFGVFVLSTVGDAFRPANLTAVGSYSKPANVTRSLSLVRMAINLGWSFGPAIGGVLAAHLGYDWLFIADGLTCIIAALVMRIFLPPRRARQTEEEEESETDIQRSPYRDVPFLIFTGAVILIGTSFMQFIYTLPVYFKTGLGLNEDQIGLLLALNGLAIGLTEVTLVYVLEKRFPKFAMIISGAILIGLAYVVLNIDPNWAGMAIVCMALLTVGEILNFPFCNSFAIGRSTAQTRGQYMSFYTMSFALAAILAPSIGLQVADRFGYATLWTLIGVMVAIATLAFVVVDRLTAQEASLGSPAKADHSAS